MIDVYARFIFIDPVDDAIAPYSIGVVTVEFAGQFCPDLGFIEQCIYGRSNEPFDFRRQFGNEACAFGGVASEELAQRRNTSSGRSHLPLRA